MPKWSEYKKAAKERGSLAYELFAVESTVASTPEFVKENLPDHLEYQRTLEIASKLAFAGPLSDETGEMMEGNGLIIYRASSIEEARELANNDPMHLTGARSFLLRRWLINEGSISLNLGLSTASIKLD